MVRDTGAKQILKQMLKQIILDIIVVGREIVNHDPIPECFAGVSPSLRNVR